MDAIASASVSGTPRAAHQRIVSLSTIEGPQFAGMAPPSSSYPTASTIAITSATGREREASSGSKMSNKSKSTPTLRLGKSKSTLNMGAGRRVPTDSSYSASLRMKRVFSPQYMADALNNALDIFSPRRLGTPEKELEPFPVQVEEKAMYTSAPMVRSYSTMSYMSLSSALLDSAPTPVLSPTSSQFSYSDSGSSASTSPATSPTQLEFAFASMRSPQTTNGEWTTVGDTSDAKAFDAIVSRELGETLGRL